MVFQFGGEAFHDPLDVGLHQVVVRPNLAAELGVGPQVPSVISTTRSRVPCAVAVRKHQRDRRPAGDQVGVQAICSIRSSHARRAPTAAYPTVATEDVVDQHVETPLLTADARDQGICPL